MKLLIYTIFTFNLITQLITADEVTSNLTTATTASTKKTSEATTVNPNLSQNDAIPQSQYNSQRPNYKIAYNQGGATLTAFPVLSKIASIKRERSSVDYNRPLDIDQTSSGLTPQLQKLLQLPISKRETPTNIEIKNDEKKEATSKTFSAKHSNFGSNAYKQGGYEGSPDAQAATIKNYLGTMTRTVGKGSSRNQFGGYGTNLGSQNYNSGNDNSWRPQQEQIFPSQQQTGAYGLGGFPQHGQMPTSASSSFGSSSNDVMGINNNIGQGSGDMNPMNLGASSNINGISNINNNIFQGASNNMQNQWNEENDLSSNVNNGMGNIGVSQGGNNYGINTDFNTNQQGTFGYGNTIGDNSGLGINGFTGDNSNNNQYASSTSAYNGNNNFGTTDYSNLNTNNGFNNYNTNANNGFSNINSHTSNIYGTNANGYSTIGSNANTFGVNTVSNGDFSNINTGNYGPNTNDFSNNLGLSNIDFGINTNVDNSNMNTDASNNNFGTNSMGSPNLATNNFGNTGMNNNNFGSTDSFSSANTNYQSTNNFNINNNNDNNNNNFGTNMNNNNNNNNAYNGNNDYTKTGIMSYMINTENFKANNFGLNNNNNAGNSFNSFGSNSNTGNGYSSNSNFGATGNSGFNVNTIPSPVGGFNNVETSMTNNNGFTNSGYNGGNNNGINTNYGTTNNGGGNDFNSNNNNAGGFSSFGNSDNTSGNNFNSMNYASLNGNPTSNINGNSNGDFSSTFNNGNQGFGQQQQQNGYNSQSSTNFNSQQGSQTFETSIPQQPLVNQPSSQNQFGYSASNFGQSQAQIQTPTPSQPMTQGNVGGQSVYGNPNTVNYGTYTAGINDLQQSYTDQKNYLNIANKIAQQHALNKPDVYGSQYNSIPPQTYTPDASIINYGTNSMYAGASPISQFGTQNPSSLAGARFSSYGSSTHSSHASHIPKTNIYNVIAPIPTSSADSKIDGTSAPQSPPPPTTYKHGSNVYTTIYNTGYDPTSSSSSPSKSGNGGVFSGTEKIGDVYSDNYGHSELTNIYQTKPKTPTKD